MFLQDGFMNWASGIGNQLSDKGAHNTYGHTFDIPWHNEALYRTSGFGKRTVNIPASDATRMWRDWNDEKADDLKKIEKRLRLKLNVRDAIIAGRKHGGAALYMGIEGISDEDLETPLDPEQVRPGSLKYVTLFDRTELSPLEYDEDPTSPRYKRGLIYSINRGNGANLRIHWTRFAWFGGTPTQREIMEAQDGWDDSVYVAWRPHIEAADSSLANLNALIHEARSETLKIPNLSQHFETADGESRLTKRVLAAQRMKSSLHMTVIDESENIETRNMSFTGLVDVFSRTLEALGGVCDIPVVRFLGTSPGGLNSSGQTELHNYYDGIASYQQNDLEAQLWALDAVLYKSTTGKSPAEMSYNWSPLYQLSEKEQAEAEKTRAEAVKIYHDLGVFEDEAFATAVLGGLKQGKLLPTLLDVIDDLGKDDDFIQIDPPKPETPPAGVGGGNPAAPGPAEAPPGS